MTMNRERLQRLASYLRNEVPPERLEMRCWATGPLEKCGTAGCAGGWAAVLFRDEGLKFSPDQHINLIPAFGSSLGFYALAKFFQLSRKDTFRVFDSAEYAKGFSITPAMVADRIEEVLQETRP